VYKLKFFSAFALCYRTVVCPVLSCPVLSVTFVYCGQTVGWIKMKLGMQVGLGPGHIVLDGNPAPPPPKGVGVPFPIFGPCPLWPNGWMDHDGTWHRCWPWSMLHCARLGHCSPLQKGGGAHSQFSAHFYCGQTARCIKMSLGVEAGLSQGEFVLDGDPAPPSLKRGRSHTPNFRPMSFVAKWLDGSRCHLVGI